MSTSSLTSRSEMMMASSKLWPSHGMKATSRFCPSASSPLSVEGPSAITWPARTLSPSRTSGFWLMLVPWLERSNFLRANVCFLLAPSSLMMISRPFTSTTSPLTCVTMTSPESAAARASTPVPTSGASARSSGTA